MKLYCAKFKDQNGKIIDVDHILANGNKEVYERLDYFLKMCKAHGIEEYQSYSFFEVQEVDGINFNRCFDKYEIKDNRVKLKE